MTIYLINSLLCTFLLYLSYSFLLEGEKMHRFKRWFLLGSLVFSMLIPLATINIPSFQINEQIQSYQSLFREAEITQQADTEISNLNNDVLVVSSEQILPEVASGHRLPVVLGSIYCLITLFFLIRFAKNIRLMHLQGKGCNTVYFRDVKLVLIEERLVPHSFGNTIYVNKDNYQQGKIAEEILIHEYAHVNQKHSLDIIFIELLISIFWFNPFLYLFRNKIRLNHEFLADEAVIGTNKNIIPAYQTLLVNTIDQHKSTRISCNFNYLATKKRLIMMTKTKSPQRAFCKKVALIPVLIAAIGIFSLKTTAGILPEITGENIIETIAEEPEMVYPGKGLSENELNEFNQILDKYIEKKEAVEKKDGKGFKLSWNMKFSKEDHSRLFILYVQMNKEQRSEQSYIYFKEPLTSSLRTTQTHLNRPNADQWKKIKVLDNIWLDDKKIEKSELASTNRGDIVFYAIRKTNATGTTYFLWTKKGYDAYRQQYGKQISVEKLLEIEPTASLTFERINYDKDKNGQRFVMTSGGKVELE